MTRGDVSRGSQPFRSLLSAAVFLGCSMIGLPDAWTPASWPPVPPVARSEQGHRPPGSTTRIGAPRLELVERTDTGSQPKSVNVSPDGSRVVVCNFGFRDHDNVWVYDAQTLVHIGTVTFQGNAVETAFSHDGHILYVSNFRGAKVMVVDMATLTVRGEIDVGLDP